MAIEVSIPKEITEYKEKIIFGLSIRQLVCFIIAILTSIGTYFLCTLVFNMTLDATSYVIIFEAMPLMAIGFIKKDGMDFEKYIALLIRHKTGINKLKYQTESIIDDIPETGENGEIKERKSKYAWIFEKDETGAAAGSRSKKQGKQESAIRECQVFTTTKKGKQIKSKAARRSIKAARQEYKRAKRRIQKEAKKRSSTKINSTAN